MPEHPSMQRRSRIAENAQYVLRSQWVVEGETQAQALALALTEALAVVEKARAKAQALALALVMALAEAQTQAEEEEAWAEERGMATWPEAEAAARAAARAQAWAWAWARPTMLEPAFTYQEVLADSKLNKIIYSIKPRYRYTLARHLHRRSQKYWWLIQIIVPITRLPTELLQQIFLIIIDEASGPPLVLMQVCKHWYTIVTSIWASLELGITTPKDAVTNKLERNQWFLDILVDTESDRGDFTPSEVLTRLFSLR
jgi:hypothetical protein